MHLVRASDGQRIHLATTPLASAGEGKVYALPRMPGLLAKIYHAPLPEHAQKLSAMVAAPPSGIPAGVRFAWPSDVLHVAGRPGACLGFVMPWFQNCHPLHELCRLKTRVRVNPLFNYRLLYRAARSLAASAAHMHLCGHLVGDLNETNVLVDDAGTVCVIDTDSFQVRVGTRVFPCRVGKSDFTAPELLRQLRGSSFAQLTRTEAHDRFALGVLLFQMLMEGVHPFDGGLTGSAQPLSREEMIAGGHYAYARTPKASVSRRPTAPPFELLPPALRDLFGRCFEGGYASPAARPAALDWVRDLLRIEEDLVTCRRNEQHVYPNHLPACPWCERKRLFGDLDPFPSVEACRCRLAIASANRLPARTKAPSKTSTPPAAPVPKPAHPCPICKKKFKEAVGLAQHTKAKHCGGGQPPTCSAAPLNKKQKPNPPTPKPGFWRRLLDKLGRPFK
ncbi:MAG TPA: hypothetical protein VD866_04885 [Urbifossiella sp.]|nr:hypothetical protein [Urbifossiella sp.]